MTGAVVVDASVAVKWFFIEEDSDRADELASRQATLCAPSLVIAEIANALWKRHRKGVIDRDGAAVILHDAGRYFSELVESETLLPRALGLSLELDHPIYDCIYVALAEQRGMDLVTADRRLLTRFEKTPLARHLVLLSDWRP